MRKVIKILFHVTLWLGLLFSFLILYKIYQAGNLNFGKISYDIIGVVGDFTSGIVGTLFSISTLLLVWLTYTSQKEELSNTRQLLNEQNFDSKFFQLLEGLTFTINAMDLRIMKTVKDRSSAPPTDKQVLDYTVHGRDCFYRWINTYKYHIKREKDIAAAITATYKKNEADLGPYVKMIKNILNIIDDRDNNGLYVDTFASTFSGYELVLMNYLMHSEIIEEKTKSLICKFELLAGLDEDKLQSKGDKFKCNDI